jgi:hypothetical protein
METRKIFNWLAQRPRNNYTLGELYQQVAQGRSAEAIDDNRLNFTRAGRAWERVHTMVGMLEFAIIMGSAVGAGAAGAGFLAATATLVFWKGLGLASGKVVDSLVRSAAAPQP